MISTAASACVQMDSYIHSFLFYDNVHNDYDILQVGNCFKGRVSHFFFILAQVPLGIIYDGKIVETGRSDLETVQKCKNSVFLGPRIWHSNCGGCPKFGTETAGGVLNSALKLRGVS